MRTRNFWFFHRQARSPNHCALSVAAVVFSRFKPLCTRRHCHVRRYNMTSLLAPFLVNKLLGRKLFACFQQVSTFPVCTFSTPKRPRLTQQMTTKVAPAYDGRTSFFAFEDALDDWCDITELEAKKRGPALRNRLVGDAAQYKRLLDRELLRDPTEGVNYFKRFWRPHFIKGAQTVFLY